MAGRIVSTLLLRWFRSLLPLLASVDQACEPGFALSRRFLARRRCPIDDSSCLALSCDWYPAATLRIPHAGLHARKAAPDKHPDRYLARHLRSRRIGCVPVRGLCWSQTRLDAASEEELDHDISYSVQSIYTTSSKALPRCELAGAVTVSCKAPSFSGCPIKRSTSRHNTYSVAPASN